MSQFNALQDWMSGAAPLPEETGSPGFKDFRDRARQRLRSHPDHKRRDERWKYFPLEKILSFPTAPAEGSVRQSFSSGLSLKPQDQGLLLDFGSRGKNLPSPSVILPGVDLQTLEQELSNPRAERVPARERDLANPLVDFNAAWLDAGLFLTVQPGQRVSQPIWIHLQDSGPQAHLKNIFQPRLDFKLGHDAQAALLIDMRHSERSPELLNAVLDIRVGKRADLKIIFLHRGSSGFTKLMHHRVSVEEFGRLNFTGITEGGGLGRLESEIDLGGAGARAEYRMLALGAADSRFHHQVAVRHGAPDTQSHQVFKSVLTDKAQGEVSSLVHVLREGKNADSRQMIRNILFSQDARVWARPQLQIYADQVQCSHGAATGPLNPEEVFYLESRGLEPSAARLLIASGFLADMISPLEPDGIRTEMEGQVRQLLQKMIV